MKQTSRCILWLIGLILSITNITVAGGTHSFKKEMPIVAVIPFDAIELYRNDANTLNNRFITELHNINIYSLVERIKIESILEEQKFQLSGCTSTECLVIVGRLANARFVIAGHYGIFGKTTSVSIRMIDVETGEIVRTSSVDHSTSNSNMLTLGMRHLAYDIADKPLPREKTSLLKPLLSSKTSPPKPKRVNSHTGNILEFGYHVDTYLGLAGEQPTSTNGAFLSIALYNGDLWGKKVPGYIYLGVDYSNVNYLYLEKLYDEDEYGWLYAIDWAVIPYVGFASSVPISKQVTIMPFCDFGIGIQYGYYDDWDPSLGDFDEVKVNQFAFSIDGGLRFQITPLNLYFGTSISTYFMYPRISIFVSYGMPF